MPKRVDAQQQRALIANAALTVIDGVGLDAVRLRDVAREARLTTGAVTHYFDGKDAVLEAALSEVVRSTLSRLEHGRSKAPRNVSAFVEQLSCYLPLGGADKREWRIWIAFWGRAIVDKRLRAIHSQYYASFVAHVEWALSVLKPDSKSSIRKRYADSVIAALDGVGTRATLEPDDWPARRQKDTLAMLALPLLQDFMKSA